MRRTLRLVAMPVQALFLVVWSCFWISAALAVFAVTRRRTIPLAMARHCWAPGLLWAAGVTLDVLCDREAHGASAGPCVFVMNHQSMLDIPVAFTGLRANIRFMGKKELARVPFLGWYMRAMGMILVDRGDRERARTSMQHAADVVRAGANLLVFPEGTYRGDGRIGDFKRGAFVIAIEAGAPIVPVAVDGSARVLAPGGFRIVPGTVRVVVGRPVWTSGLVPEDSDALAVTVRERVVDMCDSLRSRRLEGRLGGMTKEVRDVA
jgi:1-acyl-sn-glycerol-3-phosphate acyltransferase